jgi:hypothetical protein
MLLQRAGWQAHAATTRHQHNKLRALTVVRSLHHHDNVPSRRFPIDEGLPLSLFHPFKKLPADGTTVPAEEELCDPEEEKCNTALHVYEARCTICDGTGWARAPTNGRRGQLGTCMCCHGLGYVRRTTSRFVPDDPDKHMTIARPLTWNGKFAARSSSSPIKISKEQKLNSHKSSSSNGNGKHGPAQ